VRIFFYIRDGDRERFICLYWSRIASGDLIHIGAEAENMSPSATAPLHTDSTQGLLTMLLQAASIGPPPIGRLWRAKNVRSAPSASFRDLERLLVG
jgi:hypothetical protein